MTEKIVLIGAGSAVFTRGLIADLISRRTDVVLGLVDTNVDALDVAERLAAAMVDNKAAPIRIEASTDRRDILPGATTVVCTIAVGGRRSWMEDILIPRKYGIYQPVGDTIMPGGLSRALRMVPAMISIAEDVLDLSPRALFFNYGNPMSAVCRGVRKVTGAHIVGLCHGVNHVARFLARTLGVDPNDIRYNAVGVNHLTWFTELRIAGVDVFPDLRALGKRKLAELFDDDGNPTELTGRIDDNPFSWWLLRLFDAFPAVLDRHVSEFFPSFFARKGSYFGSTLGIERYSMEATIERGDLSFEEMRAVAHGDGELPDSFFDRSSGEHEQVIDIVDNVRRDGAALFSANLPNRGQIPNLPADVIVEAPAVVDGSGIRPVQQEPLSAGLIGTFCRPIAAVETVVEAAVEGSREKFVQALLIDGSVPDCRTAEALADELIAAHSEHLPAFSRGPNTESDP